MILHKKYVLSLFLTPLLLSVLWSCIDIPTEAPEVPDFRSHVRYVHLASGLDTISHNLSTDTVRSSAVQTSSRIVAGDTVRETDSLRIVVSRVLYKRYEIDFASPIDVIVDKKLTSTLTFSSATPYVNTPAGDRTVQLRMSGKHVDTLVVVQTDSIHNIRRDTLGKGSSRFDTTVSTRTATPRAVSVPPSESIVADSISPSMSFQSYEKTSVFLIHDTEALFPRENGLAKYGVVRYASGHERDAFNSTVYNIPDTVGLRFVNASKNTGGAATSMKTIRLTRLDTAITKTVDSLEFASRTDYRKFASGSYRVRVFAFGSSVPVDSIPSISLDERRRYSFAVVDSATTFRLRSFEDD